MRTLNRFLLPMLFLVLYSCDDIVEEDITDDAITIMSPQNNAIIESNVVNFKWNAIDGADKYRIQVYTSNQTVMLDSLVNTTSFTYGVNAGTYQWRVRGENFAYQTAYNFPSTFTLIETNDLSNQQVQLSFPAGELYTSSTALTFSWSNVDAADYYLFQLIKNGLVIHEQSDITNTSYTLTNAILNSDGKYTWKIKAVNDFSQSQFSSRIFYIDTTPPNNSLPVSPVNNFMGGLNDEIELQWSIASDSGSFASTLNYVIEIANDQSFNSVIQSVNTSLTSYQYTFPAQGVYYWRVKVVDLAGNTSSYSTFNKITIE